MLLQDAQRLFELRAASLQAELETYNDIMLVDVRALRACAFLRRARLTPRDTQHTEGPGDLSGKTLALLESASLQYDAVFVVKADDDVWLNLRELAASLRARRLSERLYMGCLRAGSPLRFTGTMYAHLAVGESLQFADPEPSVLPYAAGQVYVLSRELALHLAESSRLLRHFGNEDVSVGAVAFIQLQRMATMVAAEVAQVVSVQPQASL